MKKKIFFSKLEVKALYGRSLLFEIHPNVHEEEYICSSCKIVNIKIERYFTMGTHLFAVKRDAFKKGEVI